MQTLRVLYAHVKESSYFSGHKYRRSHLTSAPVENQTGSFGETVFSNQLAILGSHGKSRTAEFYLW